MHLATCAVLLAAERSLLLRVAVLAGCLALGVLGISIGRSNVRERTAEEMGGFALLFSLLGGSRPIEGRAALVTGWLRIGTGLLLIVYGVLFCFFPAALED